MGLAGIKTYSAIMCKIILGVGQLRTHLKVVYLLLEKRSSLCKTDKMTKLVIIEVMK